VLNGLKESGFCAFVQASATRAGRQITPGIVREFHVANPAEQAVPERALCGLSPGELIRDPDKKYSGEKNQEAHKNQPRKFDRDHCGVTGCKSLPH
jgi:hypothetical protein